MQLIKSAIAPFLLAILCSGCSEEVQEKAEVARPAKIITVTKGAATATRTYPGQAYATESAKLSFRISGPLLKLPVKGGQRVKTGQLLAQIDPRDFETKLSQASASITQLKAELDTAEKELERQDILLKGNATSRAVYDKAKGAFDSLTASLTSLEAQQKAAEDAVKDTMLTAPFDGVIAETYVENFEDVGAKQQILLLQDLSKIDIKVEVPEHLMVFKRGSVAEKAGIKAEFTSLPGRLFDVVVKEMTTEADPTTNTYSVTVTMDAPDDVEIKSGMTCNVIHTSGLYGSSATITVPTNAVFNDENGMQCVWSVTEASRLSKRSVTVGEITQEGMGITIGLEPGEKIIASGVHYAFENMLVKPLVKK